MNITFNYVRSLSLKNKKLLITGGQVLLTDTLLDKFLNTEISEIRILSRDEKKQHDMRVTYNNPKSNNLN